LRGPWICVTKRKWAISRGRKRGLKRTNDQGRSNSFQGEVIGEGGPRATRESTGGCRRDSLAMTNGPISASDASQGNYGGRCKRDGRIPQYLQADILPGTVLPPRGMQRPTLRTCLILLVPRCIGSLALGGGPGMDIDERAAMDDAVVAFMTDGGVGFTPATPRDSSGLSCWIDPDGPSWSRLRHR